MSGNKGGNPLNETKEGNVFFVFKTKDLQKLNSALCLACAYLQADINQVSELLKNAGDRDDSIGGNAENLASLNDKYKENLVILKTARKNITQALKERGRFKGQYLKYPEQNTEYVKSIGSALKSFLDHNVKRPALAPIERGVAFLRVKLEAVQSKVKDAVKIGRNIKNYAIGFFNAVAEGARICVDGLRAFGSALVDAKKVLLENTAKNFAQRRQLAQKQKEASADDVSVNEGGGVGQESTVNPEEKLSEDSLLGTPQF